MNFFLLLSNAPYFTHTRNNGGCSIELRASPNGEVTMSLLGAVQPLRYFMHVGSLRFPEKRLRDGFSEIDKDVFVRAASYWSSNVLSSRFPRPNISHGLGEAKKDDEEGEEKQKVHLDMDVFQFASQVVTATQNVTYCHAIGCTKENPFISDGL